MSQDFTATLQPQAFYAQLATAGPPGPPGPAGSITPWTSDVDAAGFHLQNAGQIGVATATPNYPLDVVGDINISGHYRRGGVQLSISNQSVLTASRAANTVYQNTTGKTMFIMTCWDLGGRNSTLSGLSDSANPPTTEVAQIADTSTSSTTVELFFMVLPNNFYNCSVSAGSPTLVSWVEYT
jgi:hypothetical protein